MALNRVSKASSRSRYSWLVDGWAGGAVPFADADADAVAAPVRNVTSIEKGSLPESCTMPTLGLSSLRSGSTREYPLGAP